jgi:hypothetical protein
MLAILPNTLMPVIGRSNHTTLPSSLVLAQPQPPSHVPPDHIAVNRRFVSLVLAIRIERLAQHAGVEESV